MMPAAHGQGRLSTAPDESAVYVLIAGFEALSVRHLAQGTEAQLVELAPKMAELVLRSFGLR